MQAFPPGAPVRVIHDKPWKQTLVLRGTVKGWRDGELVIARRFTPGGEYDSLKVPKLKGDHGTIEVVEGSWVLRRSYLRADGTPIGEIFNIQTPALFGAGEVHYTDLEIDVVRWPEGRIEIVDQDDLEAAVQAGGISPDLAATARGIAQRLVSLLRQGGDWREADQPWRAADQPT